MKLQTRVLVILASFWVLVSLVTYLTSHAFLKSRFENVERHQVISELLRTSQAFNAARRSLGLLSNDWGQWNDLYDYMDQKNSKFSQANLTINTLNNAKINLVLFFDTNYNLFDGRNYNLNDNKFIPLPPSLLLTIHEQGVLRGITERQPLKTGIILTPQGYLVFSASAILKSDGKGPMRGIVLMGYFFGQNQIEMISRIIRIPITFYNFPLQTKDVNALSAKKILATEESAVIPNNKNTIYGFALLRDINQKPIGMYRITVSRVLYNEGIHTLDYYLITLVMFGIIMLALLWFLLKFFVLDRLISVSKQVVNLTAQSRFSGRITVSGQDEVTQMVRALNSLLEIIELTQEQLFLRISQRTGKLERLSQLNRNLFNEINHQKSIEAELRKDEQRLHQMAFYDALTGLPNRIFFNELLTKAIDKSKKSGTGFAVIFMDANNFKQINDNYGHDVGDNFLKHVAKQLKTVIKDSDVVARFSGDEFIVFLGNIKDKVVIDLIAKKIVSAVSRPFVINESVEIIPSFSIGISICPDHGETVEELERNADLAMYFAKRSKLQTWCYYDTSDETLLPTGKPST